MADTIITNTPERGTASDTSALGLVLVVIVLAAVVLGGYFLYKRGGVGVPNTGTNINVTVPNPTDGGNSGGNAGGAPATQ